MNGNRWALKALLGILSIALTLWITAIHAGQNKLGNKQEAHQKEYHEFREQFVELKGDVKQIKGDTEDIKRILLNGRKEKP